MTRRVCSQACQAQTYLLHSLGEHLGQELELKGRSELNGHGVSGWWSWARAVKAHRLLMLLTNILNFLGLLQLYCGTAQASQKGSGKSKIQPFLLSVNRNIKIQWLPLVALYRHLEWLQAVSQSSRSVIAACPIYSDTLLSQAPCISCMVSPSQFRTRSS